MQQPDRDEVYKMIDEAVNAAYARLGGLAGAVNGIVSVLGNHTFTQLPATTIPITTGETPAGSVDITAKGPGNFRYQIAGSLASASTTPVALSLIATWTLNGSNTIHTHFDNMLASPNFTSNPNVAQFGTFFDLNSIVAAQSTTSGTIWKTPLPGQTVSMELSFEGSGDGLTLLPFQTLVSAQEIF